MINWRIVLTCLATLAFLTATPGWGSANASFAGRQTLEPQRAGPRQAQRNEQEKLQQDPQNDDAKDRRDVSRHRGNDQDRHAANRERPRNQDRPNRQENPRRDAGQSRVERDGHPQQTGPEEPSRRENPHRDADKQIMNHNDREHHPDTRPLWQNRSEHWRNRWPDHRGWEQNFSDWNWHSRFRVDNVHAYYSSREHNRVVYMAFEPEHRYFEEMSARYGRYNYHERIYRWGGYGTCYHWFRNREVYSVFVRDDGYVRSFIWHRHETDEEALALGLMNLVLLASLNRYDDDMPQDLAALYVANVLWAMADDD